MNTLLDRLQRVKETAHEKWLACCPAHEDDDPSLSLRRLEDGRLLLHCFAGCSTEDVLAAIGLEWKDLFPPRPASVRAGYRSAHRIPARDLLEILAEETSVVAIIASDMVERRSISNTDWLRLAQAAKRIHRARDHAYPATVEPKHLKYPNYGR